MKQNLFDKKIGEPSIFLPVWQKCIRTEFLQKKKFISNVPKSLNKLNKKKQKKNKFNWRLLVLKVLTLNSDTIYWTSVELNQHKPIRNPFVPRTHSLNIPLRKWRTTFVPKIYFFAANYSTICLTVIAPVVKIDLKLAHFWVHLDIEPKKRHIRFSWRLLFLF